MNPREHEYNRAREKELIRRTLQEAQSEKVYEDSKGLEQWASLVSNEGFVLTREQRQLLFNYRNKIKS